MIVARRSCGCAISALFLTTEDKGFGRAMRAFIRDLRSEPGWAIRDEERDSIAAEECDEHKRGRSAALATQQAEPDGRP